MAQSVTTKSSVTHEGNAGRCKPLEYVDIPKATNTMLEAFRHDPNRRYMFDTPDAHKSWMDADKLWSIAATRQLSDAVRRHAAWTVDEGVAVVTFTRAAGPPSWKQKVGDYFNYIWGKVISACFRILATPEQKRRLGEEEAKITAAIKSTLGDRVKEMVVLDLLATAPGKQGHGYGSELATMVTSEADAESRATMLVSSNIANTAFYESLGFRTIKEVVVGDDNPTWTEPPVILGIMLREPPSSSFNLDLKC